MNIEKQTVYIPHICLVCRMLGGKPCKNCNYDASMLIIVKNGVKSDSLFARKNHLIVFLTKTANTENNKETLAYSVYFASIPQAYLCNFRLLRNVVAKLN